MKMPSWWYKPYTYGACCIASLIGYFAGLIIWGGMVLYEKHEEEIYGAVNTFKGKVKTLLSK